MRAAGGPVVRGWGVAFLEAQRGRFVLFLPVFLAAGVLGYFSLAREPGLGWALGVCGALVGAAWVGWRRPFVRAGLLCGVFASAGFALAGVATWRAAPWVVLPQRAVVVEGRVAGVDVLPEGRRVTVAGARLDGGAVLGRLVRVRLRRGDAAVVGVGDVVRVRALLRVPGPPEYPGGWDTQRDAFFAGMGGYGYAIGGVTVVAAGGGGVWAGVRAGIAGRILRGLPGVEGAIAATVLTGLGTAIPPGDRAAFQDSGLAHLLAVAGLHVGIVMGLVFGGVRFGLALWERAALYWPTREVAAVAALVAGAGYLALTGGHVPILRSFAMAAVVTLGVLTGRRAVSVRGLAVAAVVLLVLAPESVVGVSFQMSFAAVLTLVAGYEVLRPVLATLGAGAWWRGAGLHVSGLVLTSLLAGTASLPFAAYHFGKATLFYVPANLVAVPVTAFWVMPFGLASLALMPVGLERVGLVPMGWGIDALLWVAHGVAGWPGAVVAVRQQPGWGLVLVAAGLAWAGLWRGWWRLGGVAPVVVGLVAPLFLLAPDVLVTPEAGLIAVRGVGGVVVSAGRGTSAFEREAPGRVFGVAAVGDGGCGGAGCRVRVRAGEVVVAREAGAVACDASVVAAAVRVDGGCDGAAVIDRRVVEGGAAVAWVAEGGVRVVTDRMVRGERPWVIRPRRLLPFAEVE